MAIKKGQCKKTTTTYPPKWVGEANLPFESWTAYCQGSPHHILAVKIKASFWLPFS